MECGLDLAEKGVSGPKVGEFAWNLNDNLMGERLER